MFPPPRSTQPRGPQIIYARRQAWVAGLPAWPGWRRRGTARAGVRAGAAGGGGRGGGGGGGGGGVGRGGGGGGRGRGGGGGGGGGGAAGPAAAGGAPADVAEGLVMTAFAPSHEREAYAYAARL